MDFSALARSSYLGRGSIIPGLRQKVANTDNETSSSKQRWTNVFTDCKRNLELDFQELDSLENIKVFVRVKPLSEDNESILNVEQNVVTVLPSKDSTAFKNLSHSSAGAKATSQKFTFTRVFGPDCTQEQLFESAILDQLKEFLLGQNGLMFTYGATSAGKTYTMQGRGKDAGILPRSLDVIFNSLEGLLLPRATIKPTQHLSFIKLTEPEIYEEEEERDVILHHEEWKGSQSSLSSRCGKGSRVNLSANNWRSDLETRTREEHRVTMSCNEEVYYSVWVSYAEIYNENIHDLLDKGEAMAQRGKFTRPMLKLAEDTSGNQYIKGLKQVCVRSADEALRVLQYGQENLHFAATKLNQTSSRSHCIFTVRIVQVADPKNPHVARVNMMSFCDLAGLERASKTQSRGERLKEASNINSSLLVLGRCLDALRHNATHKDRVLVPYREAKLTRLFQSFLLGQGKACILVNVAQEPLLCDETLQVLRFGALAKELVVNVSRDSESAFQLPLNHQNSRGSRFSQLVRRSLSRFSKSGRESSNRTQLTSFLNGEGFENASILEADEDEDADADGYAPLIELIEKLKNELIQERREKLTIESRLREELCDQFANQLVKVEESWAKRLKETQERQENLAEERINLLTKSVKKMKRRRYDDEDEDVQDILYQLKEDLHDAQIKLGDAEDEILALRAALKRSADVAQQAQEEKTRLQFQLATCQSISEETENAVSNAKIREYEQLLSDAAEEYIQGQACREELLRELDQKNQLLVQKADLVEDMETQLKECGILLSNMTTQLNEKDDVCQFSEEKLAKLEHRVKELETEKKELQRLADTLREHQTSNNSKNAGDATFYQDLYEEKERKLLASESELARKDDLIAELEKKNANLTEDLKSVQDDLEFCKIQLKTQEEVLQESQEDTNTEIFKMEIHNLEQEKQELSLEIASLKTKLSDSRGQLSRIPELEQLLASVQEELATCKRDLELQSLEQTDHANTESELRRELQIALKDAEALRSSLGAFDKTVHDLTDKVNQVEAERSILESALAFARTRIAGQEAQMDSDRDVQFEELEGDLADKEEELKEANSHIVALQAQLSDAKKETKEQAHKLIAVQDELTALTTKVEFLEAAQKALQTEKHALEQDLDGQVQKVSHKREEFKAVEKKVEALEVALEAVRAEKEALEKCLEKQTQMSSEEKEEFEALNKKVETLEAAFKALQTEKDKQEKTLEKYMKDCVKARQACSDLETQALDYQSKIQELEKSLEDHLALLERAQMDVQRAEERCKTERDIVTTRDLEIQRLQFELKQLLSSKVRPSISEPIMTRSDTTDSSKVSQLGSTVSQSGDDNEENIEPETKSTRAKTRTRVAVSSDEPVAPPPSVRKSSRKTKTASKKFYDDDDEEDDLFTSRRTTSASRTGRATRLTSLRTVIPDSDGNEDDDDFVPEKPKRSTRKKTSTRSEDQDDEEESAVPAVSKKASARKKLPLAGKSLETFTEPLMIPAEEKNEEVVTKSAKRGRPRKV